MPLLRRGQNAECFANDSKVNLVYMLVVLFDRVQLLRETY